MIAAASTILAVAPLAPSPLHASTVDTAVVTTEDSTGNTSGNTTANTTGDMTGEAATNDFLDLERSLSECISSNPPPGCGRVPTGPGDRGGWQQFLLFGVMMSGIGVIFWRVSRAVRRRDSDLLDDPN